jgi:hypothetical protein
MRMLLVFLLFLAVAIGPIRAQPAAECASEESHQFDFWIGEWEVEANGEIAGTSSIRPILDGCVVHETWRGARGSAGSSLNFYNPAKGVWQQFWVWRNGTTLELEGSFADGAMVLEGESLDREGVRLRNRISWSDNDDGTVRQHWQISTDEGVNWETVFDGLYRPRQ